MELELITPPTEEPVTVPQLKAQCRITHDDEDLLLSGYISAAREYLEIVARRQFLTATYRLTAAGCEVLPILVYPKPPLQSVVEIATVDADGQTTVVDPATYRVVKGELYGKAIFTVTPDLSLLVQTTFVAGWTLETLPPTLAQATLLLAASYQENREGTTEKPMEKLPYGIEALLWANRVLTA